MESYAGLFGKDSIEKPCLRAMNWRAEGEAIYFLVFVLYLFFHWLNFVQLKVNFLTIQQLLKCEILGLGIHWNLKMSGRPSNSEHVADWPNCVAVAKEAVRPLVGPQWAAAGRACLRRYVRLWLMFLLTIHDNPER